MTLRTKINLVTAAAIAALVLFGCAKKEEEFVPPPPPAAKKKAVDIFDEFYVDDAKKGLASAPAAKGADVTAAKPAASLPASGSYRFNPNGRYVVQVNSTASQGGAQRMVNTLKNAGYPAYIAEVENPTPELIGLFFRVRIGGFDALADAKAFAENALRPNGYDYWVDRRANDNVGIQGAGFGAYQQQANQYQQYQQAPAQAAPAQYAPAPQPASAPAPVAQPAPAPQPVPAQATPPAPAPPQQAAPAPRPAAPPAQQAAPAPKPAAPPPQAAPANDWGNTATDQWGEQGEW